VYQSTQESVHSVLDYDDTITHSFGMSDADEIRLARKAKGWSQKKAAQMAGIDQQAVSRIERGKENGGTDNSRDTPKLRRVLDLDTGLYSRPIREAMPEGAKDLPVYASAQGGPGELLLNYDPIDYVTRPEPLLNVKKGYGMYIVGDSMAPAYEQGDLALVNPNLPHRVDDDVIIFKEYDGEYAATVKRLVRASPDTWYLKQYNPEKSLTLSRKEWPMCHVIVGKYKRR
jgi:phage repressor protein C with HTH and peptisase S24 domain